MGHFRTPPLVAHTLAHHPSSTRRQPVSRVVSSSSLAHAASSVAVTQQRRAQQHFDFGHRLQTMPRRDLGERVAHQEIEQHEGADDVDDVAVVPLATSTPVEIHMGRDS